MPRPHWIWRPSSTSASACARAPSWSSPARFSHPSSTLPSPLTAADRAANPPARHPLVRTHPETGRRSLRVSLEVISHIDGLSRANSLALARPLAAHAVGEGFVHRHCWRAGDLVMWDNRSVMHTATTFDAARYQRLLYRAIIDAGDAPNPHKSSLLRMPRAPLTDPAVRPSSLAAERARLGTPLNIHTF